VGLGGLGDMFEVSSLENSTVFAALADKPR
jgi:hypothetical protein